MEHVLTAASPAMKGNPQRGKPTLSDVPMVAAFFAELDRRGIAWAILGIGSDIDFAVPDAALREIPPLLAKVARALGWVVAQTWQHEVRSFYSVAINPENPAEHVAFDVCSHYTRGGRLLIRDTALLDGRTRDASGFFVPSPASEFICLLTKTLVKNRPLADVLPRLRTLRESDPNGAARRFREVFGGGDCSDFEKWETLRPRARFEFGIFAGEVCRLARRALRPSGLHIALLGPDGAGKSTLIENLRATLGPCFGQQRLFKFRPDMFGQIDLVTNPTPHVREPRSVAVSWVKILYYFADWWLGWIARIAPVTHRGGLVVLDRNFDDLLVDQRRYLVQGIARLAGVLRRFLPRADATFVLEADPNVIHARKPELPVEMLGRQRTAYRELAQTSGRFRIVNAEASAEEVAQSVSRDILLLLAAREEHREIPWSKRAFDIAISLPLALLLLPLIAVIALLVALMHGRPVVFRQRRPGLHGRPFTIYKFRTMTSARDEDGKLLPDAQRLTRFGKWLRSTSLDELPELLNVLRGEMSLVGPRPLLMDYLPLYSAEQMRRHDVLPGITGWAQVNGRNAASWPQKFRLDAWYVDRQSRWLDFKILVRTFWTVLRREGVNQPGFTTSKRFRGEQCEADA